MNTTPVILKKLALLLVTSSLTACSSEPPGCSSSDAKNHVLERARDIVRSGATPVARKSDPHGIVDAYMKELQLKLSDVTDEGYDSQRKQRTCGGRLIGKTAEGSTFEAEVVYGMQAVQDDKGGFRFGFRDKAFVLQRVKEEARVFVNARRFNGEWKGVLECADSQEMKAFKAPIAVDVMRGTGAFRYQTDYVAEELQFNFAEGVNATDDGQAETILFTGVQRWPNGRTDTAGYRGTLTGNSAKLRGGPWDACTIAISR